jgi:hypothetical protein
MEARYMEAAVGFMQAFGYSSFERKGCEDKVTTLVETLVANHLRGVVDLDQLELPRKSGRYLGASIIRMKWLNK